MGKITKASKKFRQNHLDKKIKQKRAEQKYAKKIHKSPSSYGSKPKAAAGAPASKPEVSFDAPDEKFAFEQYLSDAESDAKDENSDDVEEEEDEEVEVLDSEEEELDDGEITMERVKAWKQQLQHTVKPMKEVVRALRAEIHDADVLTKLLSVALVDVPAAFKRFYPDPSAKRLAKDYSGSLKKYCGELASQVRDNPSSKVVAAVQTMLPYFRSFRKAVKDLIKALVGIVASSQSGVEDYVKLEICSVLRAAGESELVLKLSYEALVRLAGRTNIHTLKDVNLAKNLFVSIYNDAPGAYPIAFQQLRTLALHLKTALDKAKNPDYDTKVVYTWSFVQMLDFWSRAVSVCENLQNLVHPLVQVTLRASTLVPSAQYLPLRFYLVRSLIRISQNTGVYIPVMPPLLETLSMAAVSRKGKPSTLQKLDFASMLHVPANYVGTRVYQDMIGDELVDILTEALVLYSKSIAFPELSAPIVVAAKRVSKNKLGEGNPKLVKQLNAWCERVNANSEYITRERANVSFGPRDKDEVSAFLKDVDWKKTPLGQLAETRQRVRDERIKAALAVAEEKGSSDSELDLE